jgi:threonylcarbamoyladenosine tRNA methylthiotransferase MtaB
MRIIAFCHEGTKETADSVKVYITALGCKLNQSEAESWARGLAAAGFDIVGDPASADLSIVNTCTVTHVAARKSRQRVRQCARANPQANVVVSGCYAEISPAQAARLPGVCWVAGTADKERLVEKICASLALPPPVAPILTERLPGGHTRAFVKIQDGCNNACSYCIVRIARGPQRSRLSQDVLDELLARQAEGYREAVLTGVHIGAYGRERGETLAGLVRQVLERSEFPRLRLSSIEPWDLTSELLALWEDPRLCRHLHLPLQSGCDATLKRMNRRYTTSQYSDLLTAARRAIADLAVTTDVIVGFPGEDESEFEASAEFVERMAFARLHVFPFSARQGTAAAGMTGRLSARVKKERAARMAAIGRRCAGAFQHHFLGRTMDVLWESERSGQWDGLTDNYIRVWVDSSCPLSNRIFPARLTEVTQRGMRGALAATAMPQSDDASASR